MQNDTPSRCHEDRAVCRSCPERCFSDEAAPSEMGGLPLAWDAVCRQFAYVVHEKILPGISKTLNELKRRC